MKNNYFTGWLVVYFEWREDNNFCYDTRRGYSESRSGVYVSFFLKRCQEEAAKAAASWLPASRFRHKRWSREMLPVQFCEREIGDKLIMRGWVERGALQYNYMDNKLGLENN